MSRQSSIDIDRQQLRSQGTLGKSILCTHIFMQESFSFEQCFGGMRLLRSAFLNPWRDTYPWRAGQSIHRIMIGLMFNSFLQLKERRNILSALHALICCFGGWPCNSKPGLYLLSRSHSHLRFFYLQLRFRKLVPHHLNLFTCTTTVLNILRVALFPSHTHTLEIQDGFRHHI